MPSAAMKIRVLCPKKCGRAYMVSTADLEKSLFCKHCKVKFRLPTIDHYVVLEELGRGSFGVVNRVYDLADKREAAIKLLNTANLQKDDFDEWVKRARNEAGVIATIVHPNVLPLLRSGTHNGKFFMVTPLLPGQPLDKLIPQGELRRPDGSSGNRHYHSENALLRPRDENLPPRY